MNREFDPPIKISFLQRHHEYDDIYTYFFKREEPFDFLPGQNVRIVVPGLSEEEGKRSLSIASAPFEEELMFSLHIRSGSLYKKAFEGLKAGDILHIIKVKGQTLLPFDKTIPTVFIAGGIGITPFRSMLLHIEREKLGTEAMLIHVGRGHYLYQDELEKLPFEQKRIKRPDIGHMVAGVVKRIPNAYYYVAGPPSFIEYLIDLVKKQGISEERIRFSRFTGYEKLED